MSPLAAFLQSIAALAQGLFLNPYAPGLSCCAKGTCVPVQGTYCCSKGCLILIPFKLPQMSCLTLSLKCFSSDPDNCPNVRVRSPTSVPPLTKRKSSPTNTTVLPPCSFVLPSFAWFYIFFSGDQILLSTLSWCFASTSVSEGRFLMYLWREMYSTSTYSSAILFSSLEYLFFLHASSSFTCL